MRLASFQLVAYDVSEAANVNDIRTAPNLSGSSQLIQKGMTLPFPHITAVLTVWILQVSRTERKCLMFKKRIVALAMQIS